MTGYDDVYKKSPCAFASGDLVSTFYSSTSNASPNDIGIVIVIIIVIIGEDMAVQHRVGIIAQSIPGVRVIYKVQPRHAVFARSQIAMLGINLCASKGELNSFMPVVTNDNFSLTIIWQRFI